MDSLSYEKSKYTIMNSHSYYKCSEIWFITCCKVCRYTNLQAKTIRGNSWLDKEFETKLSYSGGQILKAYLFLQYTEHRLVEISMAWRRNQDVRATQIRHITPVECRKDFQPGRSKPLFAIQLLVAILGGDGDWFCTWITAGTEF